MMVAYGKNNHLPQELIEGISDRFPKARFSQPLSNFYVWGPVAREELVKY